MVDLSVAVLPFAQRRPIRHALPESLHEQPIFSL